MIHVREYARLLGVLMHGIDNDIAHLQRYVDAHPFWNNAVFQACKRGDLTPEDFRVLFGQYFHYTKNFNRYLAGVLFTCTDEVLRAKLSESLAGDGGARSGQQRLSVYRSFLIESLGIKDPGTIVAAEYTSIFVDRYLQGASNPDHTYGCAFLALGTEGILSPMYRILVDGMRKAGLPAKALSSFQRSIEGDTEHAQILKEMLLAGHARSDWRQVATRAIDDALGARAAFFDAVYRQQRHRSRAGAIVDRVKRLIDSVYRPQRHDGPVQDLLDTVQSRDPIVLPSTARSRYRSDEGGQGMYKNQNPKLNIDFDVERMTFDGSQVLDTRMVQVAPNACNERHRHAHESLFYVLKGSGLVHIGKQQIPVAEGDTVFVPRWIFHQTENTTAEPLVFLAITDFGFTSAVLGNYDRRTRLKEGGSQAKS